LDTSKSVHFFDKNKKIFIIFIGKNFLIVIIRKMPTPEVPEQRPLSDKERYELE
jgi:hypothetical protein